MSYSSADWENRLKTLNQKVGSSLDSEQGSGLWRFLLKFIKKPLILNRLANIPLIDTLSLIATHQKEGQISLALWQRAAFVLLFNPDAAVTWARKLIKEDRLQEAARLLSPVAEKHPENAPILSILGNVLANLNQFNQALPQLQQTLKLAPNDLEARLTLSGVWAKKGKIPAAFAELEYILKQKPNYLPAALNMIHLYIGEKKYSEAEKLGRKLLKDNPQSDLIHFTLGLVHKSQRNASAAMEAFNKAIELAPKVPMYRVELGNALFFSKEYEKALAIFEQAREINPKLGPAIFGMASSFQALNKQEEAILEFLQLTQQEPENALAFHLLGISFYRLGYVENALKAQEKAIKLDPALAPAYVALSLLMETQHSFDKAIYYADMALELDNKDFRAHEARALALKNFGRLFEAEKNLRQAISLEPDNNSLYINLSVLLREQAKLQDSIDSLAAKIAGFDYSQNPTAEDKTYCWKSYLLALLYSDKTGADVIAAEHKRYEKIMARPLYKEPSPWANSPDPKKRIKIGYLSSDFRYHSVGRNVLPLYQAHDSKDFEIFSYYLDLQIDSFTEEFKKLSHHWRLVTGSVSLSQLAEMIRQDGIDILIILAGHFDQNLPLVAAYQPAPVQVSFHDPVTSGISKIDYIISDPVLTPRNTREYFAERPFRLPHFYCATNPGDVEVNHLPCTKRNFFTFGSANNLVKISPSAAALWAKVLKAVPNSKLRIKSFKRLSDYTVRERMIKLFADNGIAEDRLILLEGGDNTDAHLTFYHGVDVMLDTFPFTGSTTTFEALWMGVPVLTLEGELMVGRWSAAMLKTLKRREWVAKTPEEFVRIAVALSEDRESLAAERASLRDLIKASPLYNKDLHAKHINRAYRAMWGHWCKKQQSGSLTGPGSDFPQGSFTDKLAG